MLSISNILHPLNLDSENNENVIKILEFAQLFNSAVHFIFINDEAAGYRHPASFQDNIALMIKDTVPSELLENSRIIYAVSRGDLAEEIKKYCEGNRIDFIILNHKHHNKLYSSLFDSPDEKIIDSVNIPVLLLPKE